MKLHELSPPAGSRKTRERVGRGTGSGRGKTSGRGTKGQGARTSFSVPVGFEGGQMPLKMRIPKLRGFKQFGRKELDEINVGKLNRFEPNSVVDKEAMVSIGLISKGSAGVVLLSEGKVKVALTVKVDRASKMAVEKVEKSGGKVEVLWVRKPRRTHKSADKKKTKTAVPSETETAEPVSAEPAASEVAVQETE
jgi:large subunit ribosomal protein L15